MFKRKPIFGVAILLLFSVAVMEATRHQRGPHLLRRHLPLPSKSPPMAPLLFTQAVTEGSNTLSSSRFRSARRLAGLQSGTPSP